MSNEKPNRYHAVASVDPSTPVVVGQGISAINVVGVGNIQLTLERPIDPANRAVLLTANTTDTLLIHYLDVDDSTINVLINDVAGTSQNEFFSIVVINLFQES